MSIPPEIRKYAKAMQKDGYRGPLSWASKIIDWVVSAPLEPAPIDMILYCPNCGVQHIDGYEAAPGHFSPSKDWTNPPHRSHLCHNPDCRTIWRPADVPTNGVADITSKGKADTWVVYHGEVDAAMAGRGPDGYAYKYPSPFGGLRFNHGEEVNGSKPTCAVPYWLGQPPAPNKGS